MLPTLKPIITKMRSWKEKILDYEIEILLPTIARVCRAALEKRRYSITRLKSASRSAVLLSAGTLEKRRYSITRLKLDFIASRLSWVELEKRRYSITRLKYEQNGVRCFVYHIDLKREDTRLRDWNKHFRKPTMLFPVPWKEKILDYEIEIKMKWSRGVSKKQLEKRRYSITRLKYDRREIQVSVSCSWKEKILDYEIEI